MTNERNYIMRANNLSMVSSNTGIIFFMLNGVFMCMRDHQAQEAGDNDMAQALKDKAKTHQRDIDDYASLEKKLEDMAAGHKKDVDLQKINAAQLALASEFCIEYMRIKGGDDDIRRIIKQICFIQYDPYLAHKYLEMVEPKNALIEQIIIDLKDTD